MFICSWIESQSPREFEEMTHFFGDCYIHSLALWREAIFQNFIQLYELMHFSYCHLSDFFASLMQCDVSHVWRWAHQKLKAKVKIHSKIVYRSECMCERLFARICHLYFSFIYKCCVNFKIACRANSFSSFSSFKLRSFMEHVEVQTEFQ